MTQNRLDASLEIDRVIQEQDAAIPSVMTSQAVPLARAIEAITDRIRNGGRLFYAGAGTSGRIAMLDASELPPTYGVPADLVRVLMAGGEEAFFAAVEGAEDDEEAAVQSVNTMLHDADAIIGIAASGTTPYTVAAVRRANMIGALTIGITSTPGSPLARDTDIPIVLETGPEVILGSSRMKAGTAQKLALNTISTGIMIQLGKVYSNLMIEMPATNAKLRNRAVAMVELISGVSRAVALEALEASGGSVKHAIVIASRKVDAAAAKQLLDAQDGNLRKVLSD